MLLESDFEKLEHDEEEYAKRHVTHQRGKHLFTEKEKEKMASFQSLDFCVLDNELFRDYNRSNTKLDHLMKTFGKWVICFFIGVGVGLFAYAIKAAVEHLQSLKFALALNYLTAGDRFAAFMVYYAVNAAFVVCAVLPIILVGPLAGGSGIPEVKAYLNGVRIPSSLNIRTLAGKVVSLAFSFSSGLVLGPEGPMIHIGSMIGAAIGQVKSKTLRWYPGFFWQYHNDRDRRDFISVGAAAGVAAAFGAPIGGVLFSLEEASSFWSRQLTWRTFFSCLLATFTTNIFVQGFNPQMHDYGLLSFGFSRDYLYRYAELIPFLVLGVLGGLAGALFVHLSVRLHKLRHDRFAGRPLWWRLVEALAICTITSVLCFGLAALFPCRDEALVQSSTTTSTTSSSNSSSSGESGGGLVRLFCESGWYNDMASLVFTTPDAALRLLFTRNTGTFSLPSLGVFAALWFVLCTVTSGAYLASGLFIPMMLIGAAFGRFTGQVVAAMFPAVQPPVDASIFALVGASAMMAGFSRMTISLVVIIAELTEGTQFLLPVISAVMVGKWVGDIFNESVYEHLVELKCYPFLQTQPPQSMLLLTVADVMTRDAVTLACVERVATIVQALQANGHGAYPVCWRGAHPPSDSHAAASPRRRFEGMILRAQLLILLAHKQCYLPNPPPDAAADQNFQDDGAAAAAGAANGRRGATGGTGGGGGSGSRRKVKRVWGRQRGFEDVQPSQPHRAPLAITYRQFTQELARVVPELDTLRFTPQDHDMYIDLRPYMNISATTVLYTYSFTEAYKLFRTTGLRHLPVVDRANEVVGIVTRKDLI